MTVRELAAELGVSVATVYRRVSAAGVEWDTLRDAKTRHITPAGAAKIAGIVGAVDDDTDVAEAIKMASRIVSDDTSRDDSALQARAADAEAKLIAAEARIEGLNALIEQLRSERDALRAALEREQTDRANERLLLMPGGKDKDEEQHQRRGFWAWLLRR